MIPRPERHDRHVVPGGLLLTAAMWVCCAAPDPAPDPNCLPTETWDGDPADEVCVPLRCGNGPWPVVELEDAAVIHAAPWGRRQGIGAADDPLDNFEDAVEAALAEAEAEGRSRAVVLLAAGNYQGNASVTGPGPSLEVHGRCPELSQLTSADDDTAVFRLWGRDGVVSGLGLEGGDAGVLADQGIHLGRASDPPRGRRCRC